MVWEGRAHDVTGGAKGSGTGFARDCRRANDGQGHRVKWLRRAGGACAHSLACQASQGIAASSLQRSGTQPATRNLQVSGGQQQTAGEATSKKDATARLILHSQRADSVIAAGSRFRLNDRVPFRGLVTQADSKALDWTPLCPPSLPPASPLSRVQSVSHTAASWGGKQVLCLSTATYGRGRQHVSSRRKESRAPGATAGRSGTDWTGGSECCLTAVVEG